MVNGTWPKKRRRENITHTFFPHPASTQKRETSTLAGEVAGSQHSPLYRVTWALDVPGCSS